MRGEFLGEFVEGTGTELFEYGGDLFEWHLSKARSNRQKHKVTYEEGATIFGMNVRFC